MKKILFLLVASLALSTLLPRAALAQTANVSIVINDKTVSSTATFPVSIVVTNQATAAPISGISVVVFAQNAGGKTISSSAARTTGSDGAININFGPIGQVGTFTMHTTLTGAITGSPVSFSGGSITVTGTSTSTSTTTSSSSTTATKSGTGISIPNPLGNCNTATCLITRVIKSILGVVAAVATIMFVWGGIMMLTSGGNERQVKQAKDTLVWASIGVVIIIISWMIIKFILETILGAAT